MAPSREAEANILSKGKRNGFVDFRANWWRSIIRQGTSKPQIYTGAQLPTSFWFCP